MWVPVQQGRRSNRNHLEFNEIRLAAGWFSDDWPTICKPVLNAAVRLVLAMGEVAQRGRTALSLRFVSTAGIVERLRNQLIRVFVHHVAGLPRP